MTSTDIKHNFDKAEAANMLKALVGLGVICSLLIVLTYEGTLPRIAILKAEALEKAIFKVVPDISSKRTFVVSQNDIIPSTEGNSQEGLLLYAGYDNNNELKGVAIEASGMGFADQIKILIGYDPIKELVVGFYVLESKETPGLGDKIEKDPSFLANFEALDVKLDDQKKQLAQPIYTVKNGMKKNAWEIDGITGATISSRAIGDIFHQSTQKWLPLIQQHISTLKNVTNE